MKKLIFLLLIFSILTSCINYLDNNIDFKDEVIRSENDLTNIFKKYNINEFNDFKIKNPDYYYLFAKLLYEKDNKNIWTEELLNKAIKRNNIFKDEAFNFYIKMLIEQKSYDYLKIIIKNNKDYLISQNNTFLIDYEYGKSFENIAGIPPEKDYFNLIYEILNRDKKVLTKNQNIQKFNKYIFDSGLYKNKDADFLNKLKQIVKWSNYDPFLSCLYYGHSKNKTQFLKFMNLYFTSTEYNPDIIEYIRKLSTNFGLRKNYYLALSKNYSKNKYLNFYYSLELFRYKGYKKGLTSFKQILPLFNENSLFNYEIRYQILYSERILNKNWIKKAVDFYNDYPDYYKSKIILNYIFVNSVVLQKESQVVEELSNIDLSKMAYLNQSIFCYQMYLIDNKNKDYWKNLIIENYPFSYAALTINNGVFTEISQKTLPEIETDQKLIKYNKIKYYLDFNFIEDAKNIDISNVTGNEKKMIHDIFYIYYNKNNDYFMSLKTAESLASDFNNGNHYKIDNLELLQRIYPLYYKESVLKYSKEFGVDPAMVLAVMREESYFKFDIVSYQNAIGLMQILPSTGKFISQKLKIKDYNLYNPDDNIKMGTYYLKFLTRYFDDKQLILSSYNAGQGNTLKWHHYYKKYPYDIMLEILPIYETRHYIRKVMNSYYIYKFLLAKDNI